MKLTEELAFIAKPIEKEYAILSFEAMGSKFVKINSKLYSSELLQHSYTWKLIDYNQATTDVNDEKREENLNKLYDLVYKIKEWDELPVSKINTINLNGNLCGIEGYDYEVSLSQLEEESKRISKSHIMYSLHIGKEGLLAFVNDANRKPVVVIPLYSVQKSLC